MLDGSRTIQNPFCLSAALALSVWHAPALSHRDPEIRLELTPAAAVLPPPLRLDGVTAKAGVILRGLDTVMYPAIWNARQAWRARGHGLVITSGLDGRHHRGSLHYSGQAVDLRSRDLGPSARMAVAREMQLNLGPDFRVILEKDHIHVEYRALLARR